MVHKKQRNKKSSCTRAMISPRWTQLQFMADSDKYTLFTFFLLNEVFHYRPSPLFFFFNRRKNELGLFLTTEKTNESGT